jgi:hypothetical protein
MAISVNCDHQVNERVLGYLRRNWDGTKPGNLSRAPDVLDQYGLGTHPDLVDRLWKEIAARLPRTCAWVVFGNPVLVHPTTGIIFGFAGGTHTYALRLPEEELRVALTAGAKRVTTYSDGSSLNLDEIGREWILGQWFKQEPEWCLAAYEFAARNPISMAYPS